MFGQLYTSASGLVARSRQMEVIANNLANVRTPAFRPDRALFETWLDPRTAAAVPGGRPAAPHGVAVMNTWTADKAGPMSETGNPLDLAIEGRGWFRVMTPAGERLTRAGNFTRGMEGFLETPDGFRVLDASGAPIPIPGEGRVNVAPDGTMTGPDGLLSRVGLVEVAEGGLVREGASLWRPLAETQAVADGSSRIAQGYLEQSGIEATAELVTMIEGQRLFEMQQKLVDVTANTVARKSLEISGV